MDTAVVNFFQIFGKFDGHRTVFITPPAMGAFGPVHLETPALHILVDKDILSETRFIKYLPADLGGTQIIECRRVPDGKEIFLTSWMMDEGGKNPGLWWGEFPLKVLDIQGVHI
jgi:hypothetical protein